MSEILFENKNATVKKVSKETENGAKEYVYLDLLDENGNIKTSIPLKEPKKEEQKNKFFSSRSDSEIGYTMLGNLGQIIINNWDDFSDIIPSQAWLTSRMDDLEMARNIVMHTGVLPQIEIDRIASIVRDLLRQIG